MGYQILFVHMCLSHIFDHFVTYIRSFTVVNDRVNVSCTLGTDILPLKGFPRSNLDRIDINQC